MIANKKNLLKLHSHKLYSNDIQLDQKSAHVYLKNRFQSSNDNNTPVALSNEIPDNLLYIKQKSDILEHVQNNLVNGKKVDKIVPVRNIIDEKYKANFY